VENCGKPLFVIHDSRSKWCRGNTLWSC
jgi:hypothetical protein